MAFLIVDLPESRGECREHDFTEYHPILTAGGPDSYSDCVGQSESRTQIFDFGHSVVVETGHFDKTVLQLFVAHSSLGCSSRCFGIVKQHLDVCGDELVVGMLHVAAD